MPEYALAPGPQPDATDLAAVLRRTDLTAIIGKTADGRDCLYLVSSLTRGEIVDGVPSHGDVLLVAMQPKCRTVLVSATDARLRLVAVA